MMSFIKSYLARNYTFLGNESRVVDLFLLKAPRVILPSSTGKIVEDFVDQYVFLDRILDVEVNLLKPKIDVEKFLRNELVLTNKLPTSLIDKVKQSFYFDRRFNLGVSFDKKKVEREFFSYIETLNSFIVCKHKNANLGFISLVEHENSVEVALAAVNPDYFLSGAAMNLYCYGVMESRKKGKNKLVGTISSMNIRVLNLYCSLGARFSSPFDIFVRR